MRLYSLFTPGLLILIAVASGLRSETLGDLLVGQIQADYQLDSLSTQLEHLSTRYVNEPALGRTITYKALTPRPPRGLFTVLMKISDLAGGITTSQARLRVRTFDSAFVATRSIDRGEVLSAGMLTNTLVETTNLIESPITTFEQLIGKRTTRTIPNGSALTIGSIDEPYLVHAGRTVSIRYVTAGFSIESQGLAVQNGRRGDMVRVRNKETGAQLQARVEDENRVTLSE